VLAVAAARPVPRGAELTISELASPTSAPPAPAQAGPRGGSGCGGLECGCALRAAGR
jgi:hypothetical protein